MYFPPCSSIHALCRIIISFQKLHFYLFFFCSSETFHSTNTLIIADAFVTNQTEAIRITGSAETNWAKGRNDNGDGNDDDVVVDDMNDISRGGVLSAESSTVSEYKRHMLVMCSKIQKYAPWLDQQSPSFSTDPSSNHPSAITTSHSESSSSSSSSGHLPQSTPPPPPPVTYWNRKEFTIMLGHRRALVGDDDDLDANNLADAPFQTQVKYMRWLCATLLEGTFYKHYIIINPHVLVLTQSQTLTAYRLYMANRFVCSCDNDFLILWDFQGKICVLFHYSM